MARSVEIIYQDLLNKKQADNRLDVLDSTSKTAIWRLWLYIMAYASFVLETLFDVHKSEVFDALNELKPHTKRWYRNKSTAFQYGFDLYEDTDVFKNTGYSDKQIANSKIIKYAAVTEAINESRLIIKIATENAAQELAPIQPNEKQSFDAYIEEIRDAGVKISVINYPPDILRLEIDIYYDPLVLDSNGVKIISGTGSGTKPVETSLKQFMKELKFDGELQLASLVDKLQITDGVIIPHLKVASSKWLNPDGTPGVFENIAVSKVPVSGYFTIENFDNIKYYPKY